MPSPFTHSPGTNGFSNTPFIVMTTELNSLVTANVNVSSVNGAGANGVFNQSNFGSSIKCRVWFFAGGAITPTAGGNVCGWWLKSRDGGVTFGKQVASTADPAPPDFIIPLFTTAYAANDVSWAMATPPAPWETFKVLIQNNSGNTMPSSGNIITIGPVEDQY